MTSDSLLLNHFNTSYIYFLFNLQNHFYRETFYSQFAMFNIFKMCYFDGVHRSDSFFLFPPHRDFSCEHLEIYFLRFFWEKK